MYISVGPKFLCICGVRVIEKSARTEAQSSIGHSFVVTLTARTTRKVALCYKIRCLEDIPWITNTAAWGHWTMRGPVGLSDHVSCPRKGYRKEVVDRLPIGCRYYDNRLLPDISDTACSHPSIER